MSIRSRFRGKARRSSEQFVEGNRVTLLRDGPRAFPAMLAAIDGAQQQVLLEMYWFDSDRIGHRFALALKQARARGCEVAVIYDALGSITSDSAMFTDLSDAGVQVVDFNPVAPWRQRFAPALLTQRDHRKMLIVDARIGFTGGLNIADRWLPPEGSAGSPWRDDMVQIEGPVLKAMIETFRETWLQCSGAPLRSIVHSPDGTVGHQRVKVLGQAYFRNRFEITRAYRHRITTAAQRIWITNAYFVPDHSVIAALKQAANRKVDVRVLVPLVSDVPLIRFASRARWETLLHAGVRIFEWQDKVLHAKSAVIDSHWSTLGSFNLDYLSLRSNLELNIAVEDSEFASAMEQSFLHDLTHSKEITYDEFRKRPLQEQAIELFSYRLRKLM